LEDNIVHLVLL